MEKDYIIRIEDERYSFEFEIKDPHLRRIYDQNPKYVSSIIRANLIGIISDLLVPGDLELRIIIGRISSESIEKKIAAIRDFEKQQKSESLH